MDIGPRLKLSPNNLCFLVGRTIKEPKDLFLHIVSWYLNLLLPFHKRGWGTRPFIGQFCDRAKFQATRFFSAAVQQLPFLLLNSTASSLQVINYQII